MAALDVNKDHTIDATELANAPAALKALDKDGDGKLSGAELHPGRPEGGRGPAPADAPEGEVRKPKAPPVITALDANGDGEVDAAEITNATAALKTLDKNNDGVLTEDEIRPAGGRGPGGPGGEGRRGPRGGKGRTDAGAPEGQ
jgi:hypothetical protein